MYPCCDEWKLIVEWQKGKVEVEEAQDVDNALKRKTATPSPSNKTEEPTATPCTTEENTEVVNAAEAWETMETETAAEIVKIPKSSPANSENNDQLKNADNSK